jgi:hypothetical protein
VKLKSIANTSRPVWNAIGNWKAEVWAAVASAFAAFISIGAALTALIISLHQEAISRDQLRATYLSNLYTKQVEAISALEKGFPLFSRFSQEHGGLYCNADTADLFLRKYASNSKAYTKLFADISDLTDALTYVVPDQLANFVNYPRTTIALTLSNAARFVGTKSTNVDDYRQFCGENDAHRTELHRKRTELFWCVQPVFQQGKPISKDALADCGMLKN